MLLKGQRNAEINTVLILALLVGLIIVFRASRQGDQFIQQYGGISSDQRTWEPFPARTGYVSESSTNYPSTGAATTAYSLQFLSTSSIQNPHPFNYVILPSSVCREAKDIFVLAVVHTAPGNYRRRMLIRETWGNHNLYSETKTKVLFAMGSTLDNNSMSAVAIESERYGDIVQEDFLDTYKNLTYKAVLWLKWASLYCPNAMYTLKVDDDIFVNIFNLVGHLHQLYQRGIAKERTILGLVWDRMQVIRDVNNKWYVSKEDYAQDYFSKYCSGSAYIITQDLIYFLYRRSFTTKFFWIDDFYVTGLLAKGLNVSYQNLGSLYVLKDAEMEPRLVDGYAIFGHIPGSIRKRYRLWKKILNVRGLKSSAGY